MAAAARLSSSLWLASPHRGTFSTRRPETWLGEGKRGRDGDGKRGERDEGEVNCLRRDHSCSSSSSSPRKR
jgi:hypothetical protein